MSRSVVVISSIHCRDIVHHKDSLTVLAGRDTPFPACLVEVDMIEVQWASGVLFARASAVAVHAGIVLQASYEGRHYSSQVDPVARVPTLS